MDSQLKYLVTSDADWAYGTVVTTVGQQNIPKDSPYPSLGHPMNYLFTADKGRIIDEYQLVYISRGSGYFISSSQKRVQIKEGDMFLLFPGEWHNYAPNPETGWYESWIGFSGRDMDLKVNAGFFQKKDPVLHIGLDDEIFGLFAKATSAAEKQKPYYQQELAGIVNHLLGIAYGKGTFFTPTSDHLDNLIAKAKILMQENLNNSYTGENVASELGISYSRFRKAFKEYTGLAPKQYVQELRIAKAKQLLLNTTLNCQQIGFETGFETPSFFHATFKKQTGISPAEYRKATQGIKQNNK